MSTAPLSQKLAYLNVIYYSSVCIRVRVKYIVHKLWFGGDTWHICGVRFFRGAIPFVKVRLTRAQSSSIRVVCGSMSVRRSREELGCFARTVPVRAGHSYFLLDSVEWYFSIVKRVLHRKYLRLPHNNKSSVLFTKISAIKRTEFRLSRTVIGRDSLFSYVIYFSDDVRHVKKMLGEICFVWWRRAWWTQ